MNTLLICIVFVWLLLLTFALIGHNLRQTLVKAELRRLSDFSDFLPTRPSDQTRQPRLLEARSFVLLVNETCLSCDEAINDLTAIAADPAFGHENHFVVLTPSENDRRIQSPLSCLKEDDVYRSLYPGTAPALFYVDEARKTRLLGAVRDNAQLRSLVKSALEQGAGDGRRRSSWS